MKENKIRNNKGVSLIVLTIILVVLVVLAGGVIVYLLNNQKTPIESLTGEQNNLFNNESAVNKNDNKIESGKVDNSSNKENKVVNSETTKNNQSTSKNNFLLEMNKQYPDTIVREISLQYSKNIIYPNQETTNNDTFSYYGGIYYYTGEKCGKLFINDKEIKIDRAIYDMEISANYSDMQAAALGATESYEYVSTLYMLFDNGTIGKITTSDIKNGNYNLTIMSQYSNVDYFIRTNPYKNGVASLLWAITKDGKAHVIDSLSAGN